MNMSYSKTQLFFARSFSNLHEQIDSFLEEEDPKKITHIKTQYDKKSGSYLAMVIYCNLHCVQYWKSFKADTSEKLAELIYEHSMNSNMVATNTTVLNDGSVLVEFVFHG